MNDDRARPESRRLPLTLELDVSAARAPDAHDGPADLPPASFSHVGRTMQLIDERYHDPAFDIHVTASCCGVTREHLARVIRHMTGRTFTQLLRLRRMREAGRLLDETALRMKDIYQRVGLTSASEFDHAFKHVWSVSPKRYRVLRQRGALRLSSD